MMSSKRIPETEFWYRFMLSNLRRIVNYQPSLGIKTELEQKLE